MLAKSTAPAPLGQMTASPADLYSQGVYRRAALALHVLRLKLGNEAFFALLKQYLDKYRHSHASSRDFIKLARDQSGQELGSFFQRWLEEPLIPDVPALKLYKGDWDF